MKVKMVRVKMRRMKEVKILTLHPVFVETPLLQLYSQWQELLSMALIQTNGPISTNIAKNPITTTTNKH